MILITGTGRCGTGYIAQVLTSAGVKCSHEGLFTVSSWETARDKLEVRLAHPEWQWRAESSWLAAPWMSELKSYDLTIVHLVRHPKHVMDSHLRLMAYTQYAPYYQWMTEYLPELTQYTDPVAKAACWYVRVNQMVEPHADIFHHVEDDPRKLLDRLNIPHDGIDLFSNTHYNTRPGYGPSNVDIADVPQPLRSELLAMSDRYGYHWDEHKPTPVSAGWFGGRTILIDHLSAHIGGAWQLRDTANNPLCYDAPLVSFFYNKVSKVQHPTVVDVGASTGNFALLPVVHPEMTVHAFEPNPVAFRALRSNVAINDLGSQVHLYQTALSDHNGRGTLKVPIPALHAAVACLGNGNPRDRGFDWNEIEVDVARLDDYDLNPDFIKIDVEGAELWVLLGAEDTIKRCHPGILVEYTSLNTKQFGYDRECIMELLRSWGYNQFRQVGLEDLWTEVSPQ